MKNKNCFGSTHTKVKAFQKPKGVTIDGTASLQTITALGGFYTA